MYHFVMWDCLEESNFSGGSYLSSAGSNFIGKVEFSFIPATYSTPPSFHSPASLTKTDVRHTLLWHKFPSLIRKLNALWKRNIINKNVEMMIFNNAYNYFQTCMSSLKFS